MLTFAALNFTKDVLLAFATHYPTSFRKALVINAPSFVGGAWKLVSTVLPKSVKEKVSNARCPRHAHVCRARE
eukprot:scaffold8382_cov26-Tisochrysis_lutea.AAC.3